MSDETVLDFFTTDYSLFIEAGFVAIKQADEIAARRLFKAAEALNPSNPASQLGLGYIALNKLQITEASTIFEAILKKDPTHYLAQALLGVSYILTKDKKKQGEALVRDASEKSNDPTITNLFEVCTEWMAKDLSKMKIPPFQASLAKAEMPGE